MFDFLFKRPARQTPVTDALVKPVPSAELTQSAIQAKKDALAQAETLKGDESAAVEFILNCQFADARLVAAGHISSRPMLDRVLQAMRNTDRRVSKLIQSKLDLYAEQERNEKKAMEYVELAKKLLHDSQLAPNQVADLDRMWLSVTQIPDLLRRQFDDARTLLRGRLETQAALQRAVIDVLAQLNRLIEDSNMAALDESVRSLALLEQVMARHANEVEAPSVPRHLFIEFSEKHFSYKQHLASVEQDATAIAARQHALSMWEEAEPSTLKPESVRREWRALPAIKNNVLSLSMQERFDTLFAKLNDTPKAKHEMVAETTQGNQQLISTLLSDLDKALQDGALQAASEADKGLRAIDAKSFRLSEPQSTQLAKLRAELSRLQGWAKWGGNVSREELLKAAEGLPAQSLSPLELAKKVGSLRERWKSLDISAGPAGKDLWHSFDAACTTAYAPAAEYFKKLADERQQNGEKARALIAEVKRFTADVNPGASDVAVDWKAFAAFCVKMPAAWHKLGIIDRKEKKQLDAEFNSAMQSLLEPLTEQRVIEITQREKLIAQATSLNPNDRNALDKLRSLQEHWQEQAKSLPLERKDEQALWLRFREACDQVFAKRKEMASAADADRKQNMQAKETLCTELEAAVNANDKNILRTLRESKEAWGKIGAVPRALEDKIEKRYKNAVTALQAKLDERKKIAAEAEFTALQEKLNLCHAVEQAIVNASTLEQDALQAYQNDWEKMPLLRPEFERKMRTRFERGITALKSNDRQYALELNKNAASLAQEVMRLEIVLGIDSPAALARERLQLQVEVLQSSLKSGPKALSGESLSNQLANLCGSPVTVEPQMMNRLKQLITHYKNVVV
jgi:DNA repair protein SbcC/Rad50